jgi:methionine synthase I (cobalamin-dependent)
MRRSRPAAVGRAARSRARCVRTGPALVGVNCPPAAHAAASLRAAQRPLRSTPTSARRARRRRTHEATPDAFAAHAGAWIDAGARAVGGCCGTTPAHVRAITAALDALDR